MTNQRRFADARLTDHGHQLHTGIERRLEQAHQLRDLVLAADEVLEIDGRLERRLIELARRDDRVAAATLRFVERLVGGLEQRVEILVLWTRFGNTDRQ